MNGKIHVLYAATQNDEWYHHVVVECGLGSLL